MKKSAIWILLTVTFVFAAFVGGLYIGRNTRYSDIQINGGMTSTPLNSVLPSSSNLPQNNAGDSSSGISVPATPTVTSSVSVFPININTATAEDLDQLPDIGPVLAQRIVAYRNEFGHFSCVEDLLHVNGIGEKTLAKIREYITV